MVKEPSLEEMKKIVGKHVRIDNLSDDSIQLIYRYIKALPIIERMEEDSLAGQS